MLGCFGGNRSCPETCSICSNLDRWEFVGVVGWGGHGWLRILVSCFFELSILADRSLCRFVINFISKIYQKLCCTWSSLTLDVLRVVHTAMYFGLSFYLTYDTTSDCTLLIKGVTKEAAFKQAESDRIHPPEERWEVTAWYIINDDDVDSWSWWW